MVELLENGADVEAVDYDDKNVIHFIVDQGHVDMLKVRSMCLISLYMHFSIFINCFT